MSSAASGAPHLIPAGTKPDRGPRRMHAVIPPPATQAASSRAPAPGGEAGAAADRAGEDIALVEQIAAGRQEALAALYARHGTACYRLARHITASGPLAEDAVQEAFVGLWRACQSYHAGRGSVRNWLLALTHHKAVDLVRRESAEHRRQAAQAVAQAADPPRSEDPAAAAWTGMQAEQVRAALGELPEAQRRALTLAYFGGYTQSQIAEITGVPLGTVKTRMFTAMRRLRLRLAALAPVASLPGERP
jgi:RNA polymerase sigma-70 factor (ECF subfamily)